MSFDDIGQLSSFSAQSKEKGLLTFYEQQWNVLNELERNDESQNTVLRQQIVTSKIVEKRPVFFNIAVNLGQASKKPLLSLKNQMLPSESKQILFQSQKLQNPIKRTKTFHTTNQHNTKKQKQNRMECIKANILQSTPAHSRIKQGKTSGSVHIKNYLFDQQQENCAMSRLKNQIQNIRIKKGSSFKGFHRQNISISLIGLGKNLLQDKKQKNQILSKLQNQYQAYSTSSKPVSNYLFPLLNPNNSFLKKKFVQERDKYEDSLNQISRKIKLRQFRNSQLPFKTIVQER